MNDNIYNEIPHDFSHKKILVVEDIESNSKLLIAVLKPTKAEVIFFEYGLEAIEYCRGNDNIDLVLMDIQLPDINGIEATKIIKEFRKDLPVIAQTAFAMAGDREKCLEAGCSEYISKPISRVLLLDMINTHINHK